MFAHTYFVMSAAFVLVRMKNISLSDRFRLWMKSVCLYIVILGFTDRERPWLQLRQAMISAMLSAVYDYDSDWPRGDRNGCNLQLLLGRFISDRTVHEVATGLFQKKIRGETSRDGLERGSAALQLYCYVIQASWMQEYTEKQIDDFGRKLQILDDLLDLSKDRKAGHKNCFLLDEWEPYARELEEFLDSDFYQELEEHHWSYRKIRTRLRSALAELRSDA